MIKNSRNDAIRAQAEELLADKIKDLDIPQDVSELIHELQVHQIELEIQNEEMKRYQSQLQTSQNRYFELYNLAPIGYFTLDKNELIKDVNIAGANLLGSNKNKLVKRAFIRFIASKSRNKFYELVNDFMEKKKSHRCELNLLKNKKTFPVLMEISSRPTDGGGFESFLITVVDITERKKAEIALSESEQRFKTVADFTYDWEYWINPEGKMLYVSPSCERITGYTPEEFIENSHLIYEIIYPDDSKFFENHYKEYSKIEEKCPMIEFRILTKENEVRWIGHGCQPVYDDEGKLFGIRASNRDITTLKKVESEIKSSLQEKEVLLREIHHRVKNNLQVISSLLNLQRQYVGDGEADEVLMESQNRVKSMAMLHEKLYQSEDLSNIRISDYVESLVKELFYSHAVKIGHISPVLDIDDVTLNMETTVPCGLLISELVSNSLKHAFPDRKEGEIRVSLKKFHDKFELKVSDNGVGLPDDVDFQKTDSLGLQLINTLVGQIEGDIELDRNQGTEFKIIFKELEYNKRL